MLNEPWQDCECPFFSPFPENLSSFPGEKLGEFGEYFRLVDLIRQVFPYATFSFHFGAFFIIFVFLFIFLFLMTELVDQFS